MVEMGRPVRGLAKSKQHVIVAVGMVKNRHLRIGDVLQEEQRGHANGSDRGLSLDARYVLDASMTLSVFAYLFSILGLNNIELLISL